MSTVKLVPETSDRPVVRRVFDDIKATKKTDRAATGGQWSHAAG